MEYIHGGNKMLKLSLKQGQYVNIGDNIRVGLCRWFGKSRKAAH